LIVVDGWMGWNADIKDGVSIKSGETQAFIILGENPSCSIKGKFIPKCNCVVPNHTRKVDYGLSSQTIAVIDSCILVQVLKFSLQKSILKINRHDSPNNNVKGMRLLLCQRFSDEEQQSRRLSSDHVQAH
ncbi:hypothetical protein Tco_0999201, partial [Tanacetum coccineum]